jgi:hypothetical protein
VHVPRTISRFGHQRAADLLLRQLLAERGGMVRYKILRGLGRLIADLPGVHLDVAVLDRVADDHLATTFPILHWRAVLEEGVAQRPERDTPGHRLLAELLSQKEGFAIERLFRAFGLRDPNAGFAQIYDGLQSPDPEAQADSRELLQHVIASRWRAAVIGLTDEAPVAERLAAGSDHYTAPPLDYEELIAELIDHPNETVAALASFHAAELGLTGAATGAHHTATAAGIGLAGLRWRSLERLRLGGDSAAASAIPAATHDAEAADSQPDEPRRIPA